MAEKDKHMYSITPFDYKVKKPSNCEPINEEIRIEQNSVDVSQSNEILIKSTNISTSDQNKPGLSLKRKKTKQRVGSISSTGSGPIKEVLNMSSHSNESSQSAVSITHGARKEIVLDMDNYQDDMTKLETTREKSQKLEVMNKDTRYDSPNKRCREDDWNFKLPSIKSSSGNEHFRNSQSDQLLCENKEALNDSVSVEMLEKSPDVTVFISEKDLSPSDPFCSDKHSNKKSRIECLQEKASQIHEDSSEEIIQSQNLLEKTKKSSPEEKENVPLSQKPICAELLKQFEFMKEPEINMVNILKNTMDSKNKEEKSKLQKENKEHGEIISNILYDHLLEYLSSNMVPPRVNVPELRSKFEQRLPHGNESGSSSSSESLEMSVNTDDNIKDTTLLNNSNDSEDEWKVKTDSADVMKYAKEIMSIVKSQMIYQFKENLSQPLQVDQLSLLRDLQGKEYECPENPESKTSSVVDLQLYLLKERNTKEVKSEQFLQNRVEALAKGKPVEELMPEQFFSLLMNQEHIHNKAIFDAINDTLDKHRPYGKQGIPPLWSQYTRKLNMEKRSKCDLDKVFQKLFSDIQQYSKTFAGPLQNSELIRLYGYECDDQQQHQALTEDRLATMLGLEIEEDEPKMLDVENEMAMVKFGLSDLVFDCVINETAEICQTLGSRTL